MQETMKVMKITHQNRFLMLRGIEISRYSVSAETLCSRVASKFLLLSILDAMDRFFAEKLSAKRKLQHDFSKSDWPARSFVIHDMMT